MIIIPAVDLKDGRCVRLRQGVADDVKVYSDNPVDVAKQWVAEGGAFLHIVDLDGAFQGQPVHTDTILEIVKAVDVPVEVGGGLRTDEDLKRLVDGGVARAIVGTRAFLEAGTLKHLTDEFGDKLAVGIDARSGMVQISGWVQTTGMSAVELVRSAAAAGVQTVIYTDTATDGMLQGPNVRAIDMICRATDCSIVAAGGITSVQDIQSLKKLNHPNLTAAIVGKALYEGTVTLKALHQSADQP